MHAIKKNISLVSRAHQFIAETLTAGDYAIDATAGNGHDTLFLAAMVGTQGKVYAFDIQERARHTTITRLNDYGMERPVKFILAGHQHLLNYIPASEQQRIKAAMFNLGYLPTSDKMIRTVARNTLKALNHAILVLAVTGRLSIIAYHGHAGGQQESDVVIHWLKQLPQQRYCYTIERPPTFKNKPPILFCIEKQSL